MDLPEGFVPDTTYVLEDEGNYVGVFNFRHYLNDFLREGPVIWLFFVCSFLVG